jgi:hypothetical protein
MMPNKISNFFSFLFVPHYDELSLFSMSYICILLLIVNISPSDWSIENVSFQPEGVNLLIIIIPFLVGMGLCLYHAFTNRKKTNIEKKLMIFFAAIINGFSAIWAGTYILVHSQKWGLSIFPIWNIISGYILLTLLRSADFEEETISDQNVTLGQLGVGTLFVTGIFYLCYFVFNLNWAATFSICIAWSTNLYNSINSLIFREKIKITQV